MNLEKIMEMWEDDCQINEAHLDKTSQETPKLMAKYLRLMTQAKVKLKSEQLAQSQLLKNKWLYYSGKLDTDTIRKLGWNPDPLDGLKVLKSEIDKYYYDADEDIQKSEQRIEYLQLTVDTLREILDNIKWRHQTISNMIKWRVFQEGG